MSYANCFWRGNLSGIFMGSLFGIFGGPLFAAAYPEFLESTFGNINPALFIAAIWGGILGGFIGAVIGTAVGLLLAWSKRATYGSSTGLLMGGTMGLFLIVVFAPNDGLGPLFLPLLGLVWGSFIGWGSGTVIEKWAHA